MTPAERTEPAIVILSDAAMPVAEAIRDSIGGAIHGARKRVTVGDGDVPFDEARAHLQALFLGSVPIVAVMASGALIRILAPLLADKQAEPPVVAISEDGKVAVPLLGGHRGANDLARDTATALGGTAAVTTAGDLRFGVALDAPPEGYVLANPDNAKTVMAGLLARRYGLLNTLKTGMCICRMVDGSISSLIASTMEAGASAMSANGRRSQYSSVRGR